MEKEILTLNFNESCEWEEHNINTRVLKVHNGWIYTIFSRGNDMGSSVFVPDDRR